ncbi:sugar O-acetyltransferase [Bifidobacterium jacchi]|uniref:Acetyltransferase n=1 Tax=Bifidobacterium jacchi TaxID=2490545 RepID=A0A5N5RN61_9BIFI|nr:sugar O-acetyltransferase [Bifidobacterium jacchi]
MSIPRQALDIMHSPGIYFWDADLMDRAQQEQRDMLHEINALKPSDPRRERLLRSFLADMGEGVWIEPSLHANWGLSTHIGDHVYANANLTLVDDGEIFIGDHTMIGPNVTLVTTGHPVRPDLRERVAQFSEPIHIGRNVWIGANVTVLPGVTIGDNSVIGACSLVTRDIPADSVAFGTPCRVARAINEHDNEYYWRDRRIPEGI